jgi:hypothetical protein
MSIEIIPCNKLLPPASKFSLTINLYAFTFSRGHADTAVREQIVSCESVIHIVSVVHTVPLGDQLDFNSSHTGANTSNIARCWSVISLQVLKASVIQRIFVWILIRCSIILFLLLNGTCCLNLQGDRV